MISNDFRDRTNEFNAIAECVKRQTAAQAQPDIKKGVNNSAATKTGKSQFSIIATSIGRDIHRTSEKIARLTELTKRTSLFDEQTVAPQIQRLIGEVNADLNDMKKRLEVLTTEAEHIKREQRGQNQLSDHASTVVSCLQSNIYETTSNFRAVLQTRTNNLKAQQEKKQKYAGASMHVAGTRSGSSSLYRDSGVLNLEEEDDDGNVSISMPQMAVAQTQQYYGLRANAMREIEGSLHQLQGFFTQLAHLVADQGEMLERIDQNVDSAVSNVSDAHERLVGALKSASKNRWLIVKIFAIIIVTIVIFVMFFL